MHTPVFFEEAIKALDIRNEGQYIDATAGEGGHTQQIAALGGHVLALDWDSAQIDNLTSEIQNKNIHFVNSNFAEIETVAKAQGFDQVDGILFDFGLSWRQLADLKRGFSYQHLDDPLDMRINENQEDMASDLLNRLHVDELYEMFARYSEEIHSQLIAEQIILYRRGKKFQHVGDLLQTIDYALNKCSLKHPHNAHTVYARVFQALRIAVNNEFENIEKGLDGALKLIKPEGKIVIITFHSLEDRIVKSYAIKRKATLKITKESIRRPLRSFEKSAMLRIITKV